MAQQNSVIYVVEDNILPKQLNHTYSKLLKNRSVHKIEMNGNSLVNNTGQAIIIVDNKYGDFRDYRLDLTTENKAENTRVSCSPISKTKVLSC